MTEPLTPVAQQLLEIAAQSANLEPAKVLQSILQPDWNASQGWEWELYVGHALREMWLGLAQESRLLAFIFAESRSREIR